MRGYYRAVHENYDRQWITTEKETPGGTFRSYELYNRHGNDPMLRELISDSEPTDTVYDIGANVGVFALSLAVDSPDREILAVEPAPPVVERLRANVRLNRLEDRIHIGSFGLGDREGERPFYLSTYSELSGYDRESATRWEADVAERTSVRMRMLDDLPEEYPAPDVVKIDVEGAGPEVLRGGRALLAKYTPTVYIEVHEEGLSAENDTDARSILETAGYEISEREDYLVARPS